MPAAFIDITKSPYSAVAGGPDCAPAFQQAIDDILATPGPDLPNQPTTIYVPAATGGYAFNSPVLCDAQYVRFIGDGPYVSILSSGQPFPPLIFGAQRGGTGYSAPAIDSSFFPSASGVLDGTASGNNGLRLKAIAIPSFMNSPFGVGLEPNYGWSTTTQFTIDMAFTLNQSITESMGLAGTMEHQKPAPWYCGVGPLSLFLTLTTNDGLQHNFSVPFVADESLHRLTWQVDLTAGTVLCWVDRQKVIVAGTLPASSVLGQNNYSAFQIGSIGPTPQNWGQLFGGPIDLTMWGCKLTQSLLYTTATTQTRIDSGAMTDHGQFFLVEVATTVTLPTQTFNKYRTIKWYGTMGLGYGLFVDPRLASPTATCNGNGIKLLGFQVNGPWGQCLALGTLYNFRIEDCIFTSGGAGIGSLNFALSYPMWVNNCNIISSGQSSLYAYQIFDLQINNIAPSFWGRAAFRMVNSSGTIRGATCSPALTPYVDNFFVTHDDGGGSGNWILSDGFLDYEGGQPNISFFELDAPSFTAETVFEIDRFNIGAPATVPLAILNGPTNPSGYSPAHFRGRDLRAFNVPLPAIVRNSPVWVLIDSDRP